MVLQIGLQRDALERVYEDYIDYHCHFRIGADEEAISNHLDRAKVTNDVTAFITNAIDRVNMIRKLLDDDLDDDTPSQRRKHYTEIIKNIFDLLSKLTKMNQKMQSERAKVMRNPFTLISDELSSSSSFGSHSTASAPVTITSDVKSIASIVSKKSKHEPLDDDFSRLYTDQLSKTIRFDKYNNLTEKYKLLLHHESRINKKKVVRTHLYNHPTAVLPTFLSTHQSIRILLETARSFHKSSRRPGDWRRPRAVSLAC